MYVNTVRAKVVDMIRHLGCIMDGNRRWAKKNGVSLSDGVLEGLARAQTAVDFCLKKQIPYLSLYAFSIDNLKRSAIERECIFGLIIKHGQEYARQLASKGARVRIIGDHTLFPKQVKATCDAIEQITSSETKLTVQLLFCYGGRQEIVAGVKEICAQVHKGVLNLDSLTDESFKDYLWMGNIPDPDLIIRTGFAHRLSNFLLYQAAYSELYFPQCLWPDMNLDQFDEAFEYFKSCKRNFGI